MKYDDLKEKILLDSEVKTEYDALEPEYRHIREMLAARSEKSLSREELADITRMDRCQQTRERKC